MAVIGSILSRVINDSRGLPTVEVTVTDDQGHLATASVPAGSSVGKYEAKPFDAQTAVNTINTVLAPALLRTPLDSQQALDQKLLSLDPTPDRSQVGVNSLLSISLASARLMAANQGLPLYHYIQQISQSPGFTLPTPMFNVINGGMHAENNLDFQEYIIIPTGFKTFREKLTAGRKVFETLGKILYDAGLETTIGSEGGYAPNLSTNEEGIGYLVKAVEKAGFTAGQDFWLGLDIAASSLPPTYSATVDSYVSLFQDFPLLIMEDPFTEDDFEHWTALHERVAKMSDPQHPHFLVGDDFFAGSRDRLVAGINHNCANSILVKMNQAATLSELLEVINLARQSNYLHILSHRSGETLDSFVSDLAIGTAAAFIKAGSPSDQAPERIVKYERIAAVEEELNIASYK